MKEIKAIVKAYEAAAQSNEQMALATIVQVQGSSYRRPGARMLITDSGRMTGAISGGCLENDVLRKAMLVMSRQSPMLVTYNSLDEEDNTGGTAQGCNGIVHILIEPVVAGNSGNAVLLLSNLLATRQNYVVATIYNVQDRHAAGQGTMLVLPEHGDIAACTALTTDSGSLVKNAEVAMEAEQSAHVAHHTGTCSSHAFIEFIRPAISLVIAGAGNDVMPLIQAADILGWETTIADGRPNYATRARFPQAGRIVVTKPRAILDHISIDARTVAVLMTHNYNYDTGILQLLLREDIGYIGVLGPKKKLQRMLADLAEQGCYATAAQLNKMHGPVGLDIGAETAEEIAIAIVAEIKAVMSARNGRPLKHKKEPIHAKATITHIA